MIETLFYVGPRGWCLQTEGETMLRTMFCPRPWSRCLGRCLGRCFHAMGVGGGEKLIKGVFRVNWRREGVSSCCCVYSGSWYLSDKVPLFV